MFDRLSDEALQQTVDVYIRCGLNKTKTAEELGIARSALQKRIKQAIKRGFYQSPLIVKKQSINRGSDGSINQVWDKTGMASLDPTLGEDVESHTVRKVSTLYDAEGRIQQQWVQTTPVEAEKATAWESFAEGLKSSLPKYEPIPEPKHPHSETLACYPVGDHHLGMLAWHKETGDSYDLEIGEKLLNGATNYLMSCTPDSKQALIAFLGDFMHYDSFEPVTPTSRNQLDADGRYPNMVRTAVRCMRYMIETALAKHQNVHVIVEIGNHDFSSSIFLMECLRCVYENEPRLTIDTSPAHYHYFRYGKVLIGTHHGHGTKMENLPIIMATEVPKWWGESQYRYIWTGHLHSAKRVTQGDQYGVDVEQFRVLPPADAWAAQKGYRSIRDMKAIIMHREYGEIGRITVNPDMLKEI